MATQATASQTGTTPPYTSYATFKNLINQLREHARLPNKIDGTVLSKFSGSQRKALLPALRFFGLTDSDDRPTELFANLHAAHDTSEKAILKSLLDKHYPSMVKELASGTATTLREAFDFPNTADTTKKSCLAFFIAAAKDAGFEISPHVLAKVSARRKRKDSNAAKPARKHQDKAGAKLADKEEEKTSANLVMVPIPMGLKTWQIRIDRQFTKAEADHFIEIVTRTIKLMTGQETQG